MKISEYACYEIMLNYNCNAKCMFCSQGNFDKSLSASFDEVAKNIYFAYKQGYRRIGFTGGEPLVSPNILKAIALSKAVGFPFIRVQTNGIKLGDEKFCKKLYDAGLTFCKFSITSDIESEHDKLMGVKGAYKNAVKGIQNMRALKIRVSVNIIVNKYNYNRLSDIMRSFLAMGVRHFIIVYPLYIGSMEKNASVLSVSLEECKKYFGEAIELMEDIGLANEILFLNVPACFLKGRETLSIGLNPFNTVVTSPDGVSSSLDDNSAFNREQSSGCLKCKLKDKCAGLEKNYIAVFGSKVYPIIKLVSKKNKKEVKRHLLNENEQCLLEILKNGKEYTTEQVLEAAKKIPLCKDCMDGNSVINAGIDLQKKELITRRFVKGKYLWQLNNK